jgi:serine/threonine protein kinase
MLRMQEEEAKRKTTRFKVTKILARSKSSTYRTCAARSNCGSVVKILENSGAESKASTCSAIKIFEDWSEFVNESVISARLSCEPHPNIIMAFDSYPKIGKIVESENGASFKRCSPAIRMECAKYGDLFCLLKKEVRFPTSIVRYIFKRILGAMEFLHVDKAIFHRDIKLENVLICDDFTPKLADFGCSVQASGGNWNNNASIGTTPYLAPELLRQATVGQEHLGPSDVFALGVMLFIMYTGMYPFGGSVAGSVLYGLLEEKKSEEYFKEFLANAPNCRLLGEDFKDLITQMLASNPSDRPSIEAIKAHAFCSAEEASEEKYREYMFRAYCMDL